MTAALTSNCSPRTEAGHSGPLRESESHSVVSNSLGPHGLYSPWNSPGQKTRVGSLSLLQGIFLTQESNQSFLHCRQILYQLSYQGSPAHLHHTQILPLLSPRFCLFTITFLLHHFTHILVSHFVKNPLAVQ